MRKLALLFAVVAALALGACGGASRSDCLVLANGGNTLCGATAASWCRATDSVRQGSTDPTLQQTQSDCDALEQAHPAQ